MNAGKIVGRRVTAVRQATLTVDGRLRHAVEEIEFDNGAVLVLAALESGTEPYVSGRVHPPAPKRVRGLGRYAIELRNGSFYQGRGREESGPASTAARFPTHEIAEAALRESGLLAAGGMVVEAPPRRGGRP